MQFSEIEQATLDIDWYFTDGENVGHVASGGGMLPLSISSSKEDTKLVFNYLSKVAITSAIIINPGLGKIIPNIDNRYLDSFTNMARKGIFSFDKKWF